MHTSGNSSIDTSLIRDIYCGPKVLFETCVATIFVDDDDDDDDIQGEASTWTLASHYARQHTELKAYILFALVGCLCHIAQCQLGECCRQRSTNKEVTIYQKLPQRRSVSQNTQKHALRNSLNR